MNRDLLLSRLAETGGASVIGLLNGTNLALDAETISTVEVLLQYSPEVIFDDGKWRIAQFGRSSKLLAEIENYSVSTGRKIFRVSAALQRIPAHEHPTETELQQALELSHGRYELLANAMIKRNS